MTDEATRRALELTAATAQIAIDALDQLHQAHDADDVIEIDADGFMHGTGVTIVRSDRKGKLRFPNVIGAMWHFTDTRGAGAVNLAKRIAAYDPNKQRSCHAWIDAPGEIAQSISFEASSWHAGSATAKRLARAANGELTLVGGAFGANSAIAGIELENAGELKLVKADAKAAARGAAYLVGGTSVWCSWPWSFAKPERPTLVPIDEVVIVGDTAWHKYTEPQIHGAFRVASALVQTYEIPRSNMEWGHSMVDPGRRTDPGPSWLGKGGHLDAILDKIYV
jgi:hypothetical protein